MSYAAEHWDDQVQSWIVVAVCTSYDEARREALDKLRPRRAFRWRVRELSAVSEA